MRRPAPAVLAGLALASTMLSGCGSASSAGSASATSEVAQSSPTAVSGAITVFAAASLTEAFETLGAQFEQAHPGATITFNVGASSALATQITQGAPADVFASGLGHDHGRRGRRRGAANPTTFAQNVMQIAVPPTNPARIDALADLAAPGVKVALCQVAVPCGAVAAKVFANARLTVTPVTQEADVKSTLTKVQLGEVDAGLVYVTDVLAAKGKVTGIDIPAEVNASTSYPIAALTASKNPALATAFVDHVLSPDGVGVLTAAGFRQP